MADHRARYQNRNWVTAKGDIYRRSLKELQCSVSEFLKVSPGELGLPKLNKDNLIELLLAIKRVAKSQDRKPIKDGAGVLALEK